MIQVLKPSSKFNRRPPSTNVLWLGFERAFVRFLTRERRSILFDVSERNLCSNLASELRTELDDPAWRGYYADTEYNRKQGGKVKTIMDEEYRVISITCDLIIHSRGEIPSHDNLIAVEMKKAKHSSAAKEADRRRLRTLTRASYDGVWSADGKTLPEHVCGYDLGLLIEIDGPKGKANVEMYQSGKFVREYRFSF